MGSGNKTSVFNQKARKPFQELADIYKQQTGQEPKADFRKLSKEDKQKIKQKIRDQQAKETKQRYLALVFSFVGGILLLAAIAITIRYLFFD
jgi:hypothetical protein